uniref:Putative membrane protein n=1 Tax=Equid alphaherpesvirus 1 TaxID=10326 RepID=A0A0X9ZF48_9ALPH|nr:putative membrane protein [Equid alphaherpesvirus 1]
MSSNSDNT